MQYIRSDYPDRITAEPLSLQINIDELYSYVSSTSKIFSRAPSAEELTRVRSGEMGFFLTPKHLLSPKLSTVYLLDPQMHNRRIIINIKTGEIVTRFTQEDINRLRLALVIYSNPLQTKVTPVGIQKIRMEIGLNVGIIPIVSGSNYPENITLSVYWAQVGFDRKRYRICPSSGVLDLPLIRRGALKHRVEVYVGFDSASKLNGLEMELLSPKLVTFKADEILKQVRIRVNMNEKQNTDKSFFSVAVKAPSAAVLDTNSEATVIINQKVKCRNLPYFTAFNASKSSGEKTGHDKSRNRMSLHDWLITNTIPDSNALNKAYLKSMRRRRRTPTYTCDPGWTLYQSRCYRVYQEESKTWLEARDHCEKEHGYLASIPDSATNKWIKSLLNSQTKSFWIGLHKPVMNGGWIWHSMEQTNFTNWDSGFPRRLRGKRSLDERRRRLFRRQSSPSRKVHRAPITTWSSSAAYSLRRHSRSLYDGISPREGLRKVCVALESNRNMTWRNTPCIISPRLSFICMKNPN
ncbi:unnamed protein product [Hymenolepis diminuta]|nr:unnamed protein product [Hymenolepis diminuta]